MERESETILDKPGTTTNFDSISTGRDNADINDVNQMKSDPIIAYNDADNESHNIPYFYDTESSLTFIEIMFGEPYHVSDKYPTHQLTLSALLPVISIYLVQGGLDWLWLSFRYYYTAKHDIGPSQAANIYSIIGLSWTFKIVYGFVIDSFKICGSNRKSYIFIFGVIGSISTVKDTYILYSYFFIKHE